MSSIGLKRVSYIFSIVVLITTTYLSAQESSNLLSTNNRITFGNYLFCERDYLRAIDEFQAVLVKEWNDSLQFKVATAFYRMSLFDRAISEFQKIKTDDDLVNLANLESIRSFYKVGDYNKLRNEISNYYVLMGESRKIIQTL